MTLDDLRLYHINVTLLFSLINDFPSFCYLQLFHFDVHEDVRTIADATIEKDEVNFSLTVTFVSLLILRTAP